MMMFTSGTICILYIQFGNEYLTNENKLHQRESQSESEPESFVVIFVLFFCFFLGSVEVFQPIFRFTMLFTASGEIIIRYIYGWPNVMPLRK